MTLSISNIKFLDFASLPTDLHISIFSFLPLSIITEKPINKALQSYAIAHRRSVELWELHFLRLTLSIILQKETILSIPELIASMPNLSKATLMCEMGAVEENDEEGKDEEPIDFSQEVQTLFKTCPLLKTLKISVGNHAIIDEIVANGKNLETLLLVLLPDVDFTHTDFTNVCIGLPQLRDFRIINNSFNNDPISDLSLNSLLSLKNLTKLAINPFPSLTNKGFETICQIPKLTYLELGGPSALTLANLEALPIPCPLKELHLYDFNTLTDEAIIQLIDSFRSLHIFELVRCRQITAKLLPHLPKLAFLCELILSSMHQISNDQILALPQMPSIKKIELRKCYFVDQTIRALSTKFPTIEILSD